MWGRWQAGLWKLWGAGALGTGWVKVTASLCPTSSRVGKQDPQQVSQWPTSLLPETIQKEGGFEAHIPTLPLDFRDEVPTRLCLTPAGTLAGLDTRQAGEPPISRAPQDPVTDKVPGEHSPRALGRAFPPAPTEDPPP